MTRIAAIALCAAAASCSAPPAPEPPPQNPLATRTTAPDEVPEPEPTNADIAYDVSHSDLVVAAEVVSVGRAPGRVAEPCAYQGVTYRVSDVLRGSAPAGELRVAHPVCLGRPWVDSLAVALSAAHFQPGAKFVLFLRPDAEGRVRAEADGGGWVSQYVVWDERFGALADSEAVRAEVKKPAAGAPGTGHDPFAGRRRRRG
jgi:hypothetical protein